MIDLAKKMAKLPEPVTDKRPPHWEYWRWDLWRRAWNNEPQHFLSWPCVFHTMCQRHWPDLVRREQNLLINAGKLPDISAPGFPLYAHDQEQNNLRQAFHFWRWETRVGKRLSDLRTIVEIGGGYGAGCLMAYRMGFQGEYIIFDLPEFSLLQQYYLERVGLDKPISYLSHFPLKAIPCDLLLGIYSLSEIPYRERGEILDSFPAKSYLFLYSGQWEYYDNVAFFQKGWVEESEMLYDDKKNIHHEEALHHNDRNNWYTIISQR